MNHEQILAREPKLLNQEDRTCYFERGYLGVSGLVNREWLDRLNRVTDEFVMASREVNGNDRRFDLEPNHSSAVPRIRRLNAPVELHDLYWEFANSGPFADIAEDLLGPSFKFHHSKLNFKWADGGEEVKWHQDIQFWPHTNYDVLTLGVYLSDVTDAMAPMGVLSASHKGPLFDLYNEAGQWTGNIRERDVPRLDLASARYISGPAGTVTTHNCRSVHGSAPNTSDHSRPLLLCAYSAADAFPITNLTSGASHSEEMIRGEPARWARFDPRPCLMPPDWSKLGGVKSIFAHQQQEN
ncbi:MAG: phytanoyl-CoA dioxygenase family protein [Gammaproteobacteria bacterium]|nr:phytanoyl-CoA dioxygenase family protein [Gammaproteobacteria bacterium]